ncbi:DNA/RNA non-specific endonuclease [Methylobacter sp.]|uniref:DNA/RNA non-specific endonuclease n=1 Tax=Methylobacter sp. TaxID=2051955 RepID=UPI00122B1310|nr:DNA/RNA non-specific endonuclease [Methylobacter sp.]TAK64644.1 MAG: hypothetical protein EPO18_02595 [Methylobacter sp.]
MAYFDIKKEYSPEFIGLIRTLKKRPAPKPSDAVLGARLTHLARSGGGFTGRDFERFIGRNDLLPVNYLARGQLASAAVGRVDVPEDFGGSGSWGTGFLITPRLMITNNHVIGSIDEARRAIIEFGYERDANGQFKTSRRFRLDPDSTFITVPRDSLDFTVVAVMERSVDGMATLDEFGFLRLEPGIHKVQEGEFVTVIQHPNGDEKFIAIRENKVIQIGDGHAEFRQDFLWYASDTAPGSSGSPTFNDNWQVVAVHHSGVPVARTKNGAIQYQRTTGEWVSEEVASHLPEDLLRWEANEGIRVSSILSNIRAQQKNAPNPPLLVKALLDDIDGIRPLAGRNEKISIVSPALPAPASPEVAEAERRVRRRTHPINYYAGRVGYDANFLGQEVPLPTLTDRALRFGQVASIQGNADGELRYEHFSIVFNTDRRLAFFTAVNIDGTQSVSLDRGNDAWFYDPRLPEELQVGDELYGNEPNGNYFDRGHLVRRLDPVWGDAATLARANEDTFHWTNCSPQYWEFNQGESLWQGLENFILTNTDQDDLRATVFTGPLFRGDDELHRGVKIPQAFWKVVVVIDATGKLYSSAYVVSQKQYARNITFERLPVGTFNNFQVSIARLEQLTGIAFGANVLAADVMQGDTTDRPLRSLMDIQHPRRSSIRTKGFGQFDSFESFLTAYTQSQTIEVQPEEAPLGLEARRKKMRERRQRDVVEIETIVAEYLGIENNGGDRHQHVILTVTESIEGDQDVNADLQRVIADQEQVFLSIRFGDRLGLARPVPSIQTGTALRLRGEWITKERAYAHGGERMSVMHFTHHPIGFVCSLDQCWQ